LNSLGELYPLKGLAQVISPANIMDQDKEVIEIAKLLGCPIYSGPEQLPPALCRGFDVTSISSTAKLNCFENLSVRDKIVLLEWLDANSKSITPHVAQKLSAWPIFLRYTPGRDFTSLPPATAITSSPFRSQMENFMEQITRSEASTVIFGALTDVHPTTIPPHLPFSSGKPFLHRTPYGRLYSVLGIGEISSLEYLQTHLLPNIDTMLDSAIYEAISYIKAKWTEIGSNAEFQQKMKQLKFLSPRTKNGGGKEEEEEEVEEVEDEVVEEVVIVDAEGRDEMRDTNFPPRRRRLGELMSPAVPFLRAFLAPRNPFPPSPYDTEEWIEFFDLNSMLDRTITTTMIIDAAKTVRKGKVLCQ